MLFVEFCKLVKIIEICSSAWKKSTMRRDQAFLKEIAAYLLPPNLTLASVF